jgi:hypothetical protein
MTSTFNNFCMSVYSTLCVSFWTHCDMRTNIWCGWLLRNTLYNTCIKKNITAYAEGNSSLISQLLVINSVSTLLLCLSEWRGGHGRMKQVVRYKHLSVSGVWRRVLIHVELAVGASQLLLWSSAVIAGASWFPFLWGSSLELGVWNLVWDISYTYIYLHVMCEILFMWQQIQTWRRCEVLRLCATNLTWTESMLK